MTTVNSSLLYKYGLVARSVACPLRMQSPDIDPCAWQILSWIFFPSAADLRRARCQLLAKKWALNTG